MEEALTVKHVFNLTGMAIDQWIMETPDNVYQPCPCGCGKKFRYILKDEKECEIHMNNFIKKWIANHQSKGE